MRRCLRPLTAVLIALIAAPAAGATGRPVSSYLDADAFHYRSTLEGGERTELSGIELRWVVVGRRSTFQAALPGMSLAGPAGVVVLGHSISLSGGGRRGTSSGGGGSGPGGGPATAQEGAPQQMAAFAGAESSSTRQTGLGDIRLAMTHRLGQGASFGRFLARGGLKLPTADESRGLGTGEVDFWAGLIWRREGWIVDGELYVEWVELGDPPGLPLQDGPAAGGFLDWPIGPGGLRAGLEAAKAAVPGDPTRLRCVAGGYGRMGRESGWDAEVMVGLSDSSPDLGVSVALRF